MSLDTPRRPDSRRGNLNTSHGDSKAVEDVQEALETETSTFMGEKKVAFSGTGTKTFQFQVEVERFHFLPHLKAFSLNMSEGGEHARLK